MIICVTDKKGLIHIVDFYSSDRYLTICGKIILKYDKVNVLASDLPINTGCFTCNKDYNQMYVDDLNHLPRHVRSSLLSYITDLYQWVKSDVLTPDYRYADYIFRNTKFISKLQKKYLLRKNIYASTNKY